jgi:hypothetical protein
MAILEGVIGNLKDSNLCIYRWDGAIIVRTKSSLTRKRVLTSKKFAKTRAYASKMVIASQIGSAIYKELPKTKPDRALYQKITGKAASLLYAGAEPVEVEQKLRELYKVTVKKTKS